MERGKVFDGGTDQGVNLFAGGIVGSSESLFAKMIAPPAKSTVRVGVIIAIFIASLVLSGIIHWFMFVIGLLGIIVYWVEATSSNGEEYQKKLKAWKSLWVCMDCGDVWNPGGKKGVDLPQTPHSQP